MYIKTKDNIKIYYKIKKGKKPFIVFIHGLSGNHKSFKHQSAVLKKYSQLLIDLRGHGKSDKPKSRDYYTIPKMISDVKLILKKEKIKKFNIIAFSLGTYVASYIRADKKILINPLLKKEAVKVSFIIKAFIARFIPKFILKLFARKKGYNGLINAYAKMLLQTPSYVYWSIIKNLKNINPAKITKNCIIIKSTNDEILKQHKSDYKVKGHHYIIAENPKAINKLLSHFEF